MRAATPDGSACAASCATTERSWRSTWPTPSRSWRCVTMTRGCWPAAPCAVVPGSLRRRCAGDERPRSSTALPGWWWAVSRPGTAGASSPSCATGSSWTWCACSPCWSVVPASKKTPARDKSDPKDAVLIGRLVAGLRCYLPERTDQVWARLQQLRDLPECAWPAVLEAAAEPLDSRTWRAAVQVALARTAGDPATLSRLGEARFARAVTRELARWGAKRRCLRIVRAVWAAATTPQALATGVGSQRPGALERAGLTLDDWHHALGQLAEAEQRMT